MITRRRPSIESTTASNSLYISSGSSIFGM